MMRILWIQISKTALNTAVKLLLVHCFDDRFHNALSDPCSVQPMLDFRSIILVTLLLLVPASLTDPCSIYSMHDFRSIILVTLLLLVPASLSDPCSIHSMHDFRSIILVTLLLLVPASLSVPCSIYSMNVFRSIILVTLLLLVPASLSDPCSIDGGTPIGMIDDKTLEEVTLLEKVTYKIIRTDGIFKMISTFMLVKLYVMQRNWPFFINCKCLSFLDL